MIEGILLENALEEILKRADRITDTKKVKVEEANGFCLAEDIYAEAQQINEDRAAAETEEFEDVEEVSEETTDVEEDTAE